MKHVTVAGERLWVRFHSGSKNLWALCMEDHKTYVYCLRYACMNKAQINQVRYQNTIKITAQSQFIEMFQYYRIATSNKIGI